MKKLTNQSFNAFTQNKSAVLFSASWCGPCKQTKQALSELEEESDVPVGVYDIDQKNSKHTDYSILSLPTLIIFHEGREIDRHNGSKTYEQLQEILELL